MNGKTGSGVGDNQDAVIAVNVNEVVEDRSATSILVMD